jgi:D-glycero-D-manno-heptose 1,7-bisphosphate phosphatase
MKIVLLDRDGTVIVDPPDERVDKEEKIKLFPDSIEALRYLADNGFAVVLITNQAGIAEGRIDEAEFSRLNTKVLEQLSPSGVKVLKTYMCPHGPDDGCECRKPKPTLILRAAKDFNLDLPNTYMVGDRQSDVMAGVNAGTKTVLVKTANVHVDAPEATHTAQTLLDTAKYIVANS